MSDVRKFLIELYGAKREDHYINIWHWPEKRSLWFRDVEEGIAAVEHDPQHDTYAGLALAAADLGPYRRCTNDAVAALVSLGTDHDIFSLAHNKIALPRTLEEARSVVPKEMPPTMTISSGNGLQCHWVWKEPIEPEDQADLEDVRRLYARWQEFMRLVALTKGWAFDRLSDLARVLRVPGTVNRKDPHNPKPVRIIAYTGARYNPGDIEELLEMRGVPVPVPAAESSPQAAEWARRFREQNLRIDPSARIPEGTLRVWMEQEPKFAATWHRNVPAMPDRPKAKHWSNSEWDLSLANFGVQFGCSDQQIMDMIHHHRALHAARPRTRLDYFQRTIGKSRSERGEKQPAVVAANAEPQQEADTVPLDPEMLRAKRCAEVSDMLKVITLVKVVKVTGSEPSYLLHFDVGVVKVPDVYRLMDQRFMSGLIANVTNALIPDFKKKDWRPLIEKILAAVVEEPGGEENDLRGRVHLYIAEYLNARPFVPDVNDVKPEQAHLPTFIDGKVAITTLDFADYLNTKFRLGVTANKLATDLIAIGATNKKISSRNALRNQSRWILPIDDHNFAHKAPEYNPEGIGHEPAEHEDPPKTRLN